MSWLPERVFVFSFEYKRTIHVSWWSERFLIFPFEYKNNRSRVMVTWRVSYFPIWVLKNRSPLMVAWTVPYYPIWIKKMKTVKNYSKHTKLTCEPAKIGCNVYICVFQMVGGWTPKGKSNSQNQPKYLTVGGSGISSKTFNGSQKNFTKRKKNRFHRFFIFFSVTPRTSKIFSKT